MQTLRIAQTPKGRYSIKLQKERMPSGAYKYAVRAYNGKNCTSGLIGIEHLHFAKIAFNDFVRESSHKMQITLRVVEISTK